MRKRLIGLVMVCGCVMNTVAQNMCVMPPFLKSGDKIAVISPSSAIDTATVINGCKILREWGFEPVVGKHAFKSYHGFGGTIEERSSDLLWALRDTTIHAIMCTRGGDGSVQLLPHIPHEAFSSHPKWLIGFSDITALHSASVSAGVMSIHGSMCHAISSLGGRDTVSNTLHRMLLGELPRYEVNAHKNNQLGTATGVLVGGNFSVLSGLAGSSYDFLLLSDIILFIEDTGENLTRVDRMLHQLEIRGILDRVKGIIVGKFSDYKHPENDFEDMYDMLHEYLKSYPIPVCYDFPVGHARLNNFPMIEGCQVQLSINENKTTLEFLPR